MNFALIMRSTSEFLNYQEQAGRLKGEVNDESSKILIKVSEEREKERRAD